MRQIGTFAIEDGADAGVVSWPAMDSTPTRVIATVRKRAGGLNLFANIVDGTLTNLGFSFDLSGETDSANYRLDYAIFT